MADPFLVTVIPSLAERPDETCQDNLAFGGNVRDGDSMIRLASSFSKISA
ncbi:hypothetical protein [Taklimakanibacter albus]|uniref:Uncharacterized protein n=1 Tax=Taklimakanibacter albus TaxID=2800327 RepID=A0ACC5R0D0_9HYPH|nr:hypothetical protein [Aestuariivirga sp. YIM B02566]MBK1866073.1 hypothetical protein [Aestuariivirga sp. YIM B02566]